MNVGSLPVNLRIEAALLAKSKDHAEVQGRAAVSLIQAATESAPRMPVEAHRGRNINVRA
ncbi:MAG: hypothetical protein AAGE52_32135 [Myxococcota bacterium]